MGKSVDPGLVTICINDITKLAEFVHESGGQLRALADDWPTDRQAASTRASQVARLMTRCAETDPEIPCRALEKICRRSLRLCEHKNVVDVKVVYRLNKIAYALFVLSAKSRSAVRAYEQNIDKNPITWHYSIKKLPERIESHQAEYGQKITEELINEAEYQPAPANEACLRATAMILDYRRDLTYLMASITVACNNAIAFMPRD